MARSTAPSPQLYAGADRYATSVAINMAAFPTSANAYIATGAAFPDALTGAAAAGAAGDPLYLAAQSCVPSGVRSAALEQGVTSLTLLGGRAALSDAGVQEVHLGGPAACLDDS